MKRILDRLFKREPPETVEAAPSDEEPALEAADGETGEAEPQPDLQAAYSLMMRHAYAPRLDIELDVSPETFERLLRKVESTWSQLGQEDAHWSVITDEKFRKSSIDAHLDDFFAMGEYDIARLEAALARVDVRLTDIGSALDFGCGVGRLSIPLAKRCRQVRGVDISSAHLREAKANIAREGIENLELSLIESVDAIRRLPPCDLVFSLIVLQHNAPPVMLEILKALCSRVDDGGYLYLQVPTYRAGYSYDAETDLADMSGEMAMHVLPQDIFLRTIQGAGLTLLEISEDGSAWNLDFRSQVVLATRSRQVLS